MTTAIAGVIDASVVAALGLIACRMLRRRPASLRHLILAASLAAAAIAPILEATVPRWELPVLASASQVTASGSSLDSGLCSHGPRRSSRSGGSVPSWSWLAWPPGFSDWPR